MTVAERIEALEPALRKTVRALLVITLTDDVRVYLVNHDRKAFEQAWDALETALPGILQTYREARVFAEGYDEAKIGADGRVWADGRLVGEFEEGTNELKYLRAG